MQKDTDQYDKYIIAEEDCNKHILSIINSSSSKKIVVAGPGTGKTFLFKKILDGKKNTITLTLTRALVEDLSFELYGISDVRTLHSFAYSILRKVNKSVKVFPKLSEIVKEDAKILLDDNVDFDFLFNNRIDGSEHIDFYIKRKKYYDEYYGYFDIIYALVLYLEEKKEKIPGYDLVLVDEFQDFNQLEISLIDLLSGKSPILLTGDDDQALYEDLKSANPEHIRERFSVSRPDYESFTLPHCRRCTRVIVDAVNDVLNISSKNGYLKERIKKKYKYFDSEDKDVESDKNPNIIYSQLFAGQISWFIEKQLDKIAREMTEGFSVLIISPTKIQSLSIVDGLITKGFTNIKSRKMRDLSEPNLLDGLKILLENKNSNLGWRIVSRFLSNEQDFEKLVKESNKEDAKRFSEMIKKEVKKEVKEMLKILRRIKNDQKIKEEDLNGVLRKVDINPHDLAKDRLKDEITSSSKGGRYPGLGKIPIKVSTIESSKGLSADYVFLTHFDDRFLIKDKKGEKITDKEICKFLVSLTRAKRRVFLISSDKKEEPTFLRWIKSDRIDRVI